MLGAQLCAAAPSQQSTSLSTMASRNRCQTKRWHIIVEDDGALFVMVDGVNVKDKTGKPVGPIVTARSPGPQGMSTGEILPHLRNRGKHTCMNNNFSHAKVINNMYYTKGAHRWHSQAEQLQCIINNDKYK